MLVTKGRGGADYYSNGERVRLRPNLAGSSRCLTGAGDAFLGGFMAGLILYSDARKALQLAADSARDWIVQP